MAVTTDDLIVRIKVDGGDASKEVQEFTANIKGMDKFLSAVEGTMGSVNKSLDLFAESMAKNSSVVEDTESSLNAVNVAFKSMQRDAQLASLQGVARFSKELEIANDRVDDLANSLTKGSYGPFSEGVQKQLAQINELKKFNKEAFDRKVEAIKIPPPDTKSFMDKFRDINLTIFAFAENIKLAARAVEQLTAPFFEAEDAVSRLGFALQIAGDQNIPQLIKQYEDLGDAIEQTAVATKEEVLALAAQGRAAGVSGKQIDTILKASADIAAATSKPIASVYSALQSSLKGNARALAEFNPLLKDLSEEQARAGEGIRYLSEQYGGFASKNLETYAGRNKFLKDRIGDVVESIGEVIAKSLSLKEGILSTAKAFEELNSWIQENKETFSAWGATIASYVGDAVKSVKGFGLVIKQMTGFVTDFTGQSNGAYKNATDELAALNAEIIKGPSGLDAFGRSFDKSKEIVEQFKEAAKKTSVQIQLMTGDAQQAAKQLEAALDAARKNAAGAGLEGVSKFRSELETANKEVVKLYNEIAKGSSKGGKPFVDQKYIAQLNEIKRLNKEAYDAKVLEAVRKAQEDLIKTTAGYQSALVSEIGTTVEKIEQQRQAQLDLIDAKERELSIARLLTDEAQAQIKEQRRLVGEVAKAQKSKMTRGPEFEQAKAVGDQLTGSITTAFSSGTAGFVTGYLAAVDAAADVVQGLLDFIPNLIDKFTKIVNTVTDFPKRMTEVTRNLENALLNFADYFAENLGDHIAESMERTFAKGPEIIAKLFRAAIVDLPKQFIRGVWEGIKGIADQIKRVLTGRAFQVKVDTAPIEKLMKNLTGATSKLFNVSDLVDDLKDPIGAITDKIKNAFNDSLKKIKDAWMWVYEKILQPIGNLVMKAWQWVVDNVLGPIGGIVERAFSWVTKNILEPFAGIVRGAFEFVGRIWDSLAGVVRTAFGWIEDMWKGLSSTVMNAFGWLKTLWEGLAGIVNGAFGWVKTFFEGIGKLFEPIRSVFEPFTKAVDKLAGLTDIFGGGGGIVGGTKDGFLEKLKDPAGVFRANGGPIYASTGAFVPRGTDTVPAMLTPGEFVVSRQGVRSAGLDNLRAINAGKSPTSSVSQNITINIDIDATNTMDGAFVRTKLMPQIQDELRRASLDGKRVISQRGVR